MSDTMIIGSDSNIPEKGSVIMAPGLGLLGGVVIDQHFSQRGRIVRLILAVAMNPRILGLGIDEDTAVHIGDDGVLEVMGTGAAMIIDASPSTVSNVSDTGEDRPLALSPVKLHVLSEGCIYSLSERLLIKGL
jgi:cyanophycinase